MYLIFLVVISFFECTFSSQLLKVEIKISVISVVSIDKAVVTKIHNFYYVISKNYNFL